ncbi:hypothetical protein FB45DRAFT_992538 [Roridomyces roridus]|uniref:Histone chaperone RTT106/FACT complex subunit SPT16-like middle domain-containing protein n=1 Tax=Roridomyces roridus TaxID=1738132 RepID=A0AAD7BFR1_9AGAR|nr:hypothetical protein FB45DRAFT_992538 [Roridomyces roridus]
MSPSTPFLDAVSATLPTNLSDSLASLRSQPEGDQTLDCLIRFLAGGDSPYPEPTWPDKQREALSALGDLESDSDSKRQKTDDGPPQLTLHAISTTSPIRKKVDITVYKSCVKFVNAASGATESSIPLSDLTRAFLLPTRGKMKAHWTVVVLASDVPDRGKKSAAAAAPQIIFGLDAAASSAVKYTTYSGSTPEVNTLKGGAPTRGVLLDFISRLGLELLEPQASIFRSACVGMAANASEDGVPGVEAYRAAKAGTLWFGSFGVLWGESKPCEFWSLESLLSKDDGLRVVSATGRTCTVLLTRKSPAEDLALLEADEADPGIETTFSMVDGKEQEGINKWVREHRNLFGKEKGEAALNVQDDSDEEDEDFEVESESDGGSPSASSGDSSGDESGSDDAEDSDGEGEGDGEGENDEEGEEEEEELRPENHPLMRPGAMPRMSRAAIDMAAAMVMGDMLDEDDDGEDELED